MYGDLDRPPLRADRLDAALEADGWRVEVLEQTASTNAVVAARATEPAGLVVVAEEQTAGRGRLDRSWVSPPRAGLTFSVLLRPIEPGWAPLLGGLAVARTLREHAGVDARLKWPNDVLIGEKKVAGLLAAAVDGAVVLGIGLNVTTRAVELPVPTATSLALEGAETTDRETLLKAILRALTPTLPPDGSRVRAVSGGDEVLEHDSRPKAAYRALCSTLGRTVDLHLPDGRTVRGVAEEVDEQGRLVVDGTPYSAADVVHQR